jgi:phosphoribosyl 1,2-cyclic phosphate phosphodiesterase
MKVTVLGCGGSGGVPMIGDRWGACDPTEPRNRRRRCSILVEQGGATLLVDTSPDLRMQLLDAGVSNIDAVLWTHAHADHMNGIDDLRSINQIQQKPLAVYGDAQTLRRAHEAFAYVFEPLPPGRIYYKPCLVAHEIEADKRFEIGGVPIQPFRQDHGFSETLGFRFGPVAYSTDVVDLSDAAFEMLAGVEVWIVDCLRPTPHPTHSHVERTLAWIERLKPRRAILTHMDQSLDYRTLAAQLPAGVEPGYDGLIVELP